VTDERRTGTEACERLGELAARACPEGRAPDAPRWAAIEARLGRPAGHRWVWPALAAATLGVAGLVGWAAFRQTLGYQARACAVAGDRLTSTGEGAVRFDDGSSLALRHGSAVRIEPLPFARGAELALEGGELEVSVVHRRLGRWAVRAGPFRIEVTGTRFGVRWNKPDGRLRLALHEGEVVVGGGPIPPGTRLRTGQVLQADTGHFELGEGGQRPAAWPTVQTPPQASPPATAAAPAPSVPAPSRRALPGAPRRAPVRPPERRAAALPVLPESQPSPATPAAEPVFQPTPAAPPAAAPVTPSPPPSPAAAPARQPPTVPWRITIGPDGQLGGGMEGHVWLSAGEGTSFSMPVEDPRRTRLQAVDGKLCTQGRLARWSCVNEGMPTLRCNWDRNWGVTIELFVAADEGPWGPAAPGGLAVEFRGRAGPYRLNLHRQGDPPERVFCVENYKSGQVVRPASAKTHCWDDQGERLDHFRDLDHIALQFPSGLEYVAFRYCISGVTLYP
jgi:hypothetical protein